MMIHGITLSDLVATYIERFHPGQNILVVYLNETDGCKKLLQSMQEELQIAVLYRVELDSDIILVGSHRDELVKFLDKHNHLVCDTRMELYVNSCLYRCN